MSEFITEVKQLEKEIKAHGYDTKAEANMRKIWERLGKK